MKILHAIIVDDEALAREGLKIRLAQCDNVVVVAECNNGEEAIQQVRELAPDVIFLDLDMPGLSGFEVVQALQTDSLPYFVFVTAYDKYAVEAFELHAVDYILKPANLDRLKKSLQRIRERQVQDTASRHKQKLMQALSDATQHDNQWIENWLELGDTEPFAPRNDVLMIKNSGKGTVVVSMENILWIDAAGDYMCIHAATDTYVMRTTLKKLESMLDPLRFSRIHKSTIVNTQYIAQIKSHTNGESVVLLENGMQLKTSRTYKENLQKFIRNNTL